MVKYFGDSERGTFTQNKIYVRDIVLKHKQWCVNEWRYYRFQT
jgi:hypothetical protein